MRRPARRCTVDQVTGAESRYRYREGGEVSPWMSGDELLEAARNGAFEETAEVQMAGHAEWRTANTIRGLSFKIIADSESETATLTNEDEDRLTRFGSLRELLAVFIRDEVEIDFANIGKFEPVTLCAIATDHFETIDDEGHERTFIPLHRVRSIVAVDTGNHGSNYRQNHTLRITLD